MQSEIQIDDSKFDRALGAVQSLVANDAFLKPAVLDIQIYDETLIVLTDHVLPEKFVEKIVAKSWPGPVEVHCATDLMVGA